MHLKRIAITLTGMFLAACMYAQTDSKFFLAYDAGFMTTLDNRAYDLTNLDNSQTVFAAGLGGSFSRGKVGGYYSQLLFSDLNIINDNSLEGFQFSLKATDFYYEFGIDRKGQKRSSSPMTREQITFYSAGQAVAEIPGELSLQRRFCRMAADCRVEIQIRKLIDA